MSNIAAICSCVILFFAKSRITSFLCAIDVIAGSWNTFSMTAPDAVTVLIKVTPLSNTALAILAPVFLLIV